MRLHSPSRNERAPSALLAVGVNADLHVEVGKRRTSESRIVDTLTCIRYTEVQSIMHLARSSLFGVSHDKQHCVFADVSLSETASARLWDTPGS